MKALNYCLAMCVAVPQALAQDCTQPVHMEVPCRGTLLPPSASKEALLCLRRDLPQAQASLEGERKLHAAALGLCEEEKLILRQGLDDALKVGREAAKVTEPPKAFWDTHWFWFGVGAVSGAVAAYGSVWLAGRL